MHSEKVSEALLASGQQLHGLQTWVALPQEHEETAPRFEHYAAESIPKVRRDGADITVVIGSAYGETSPVQTASETLYVEVRLDANASLELPAVEELAVYVIDGTSGLAASRFHRACLRFWPTALRRR